MAKAGKEGGGGGGVVVSVGDKGGGASLSSANVFDVAYGLSQVRIFDSPSSSSSSKLLSSSSGNTTPTTTSNNNNHKSLSISSLLLLLLENEEDEVNDNNSNNNVDLTLEECRASLLLVLNKLLLFLPSHAAAAGQSLPALISRALNNSSATSLPTDDDDDSVVVVDAPVLEFLKDNWPLFVLSGICGIVDHKSSALSLIADTVAALSCEASSSSSFNPTAVGDDAASSSSSSSSNNKDEVAVVNDLKVLLNGSKLVGKPKATSAATTTTTSSEIPQVHGTLREINRLVHSRTRIQLNRTPILPTTTSSSSSSSSSGTAKALATVFLSLSDSLRHLGEGSLSRARSNLLHVVDDDDLRSRLSSLFDNECPSLPAVTELLVSSSQACFCGHYVKFFHCLNSLLDFVTTIVSWEAVTAILSLVGNRVLQANNADCASVGSYSNNNNDSNNNTYKSEQKKKKKKIKAVLGKGTAVIVDYIKDKLQGAANEEEWARDLLSLLNPKHPGFPVLLDKVKEIVQSNESRRLPKLPKGTRDFAKDQMAIREKAFSVITGVFKRHGASALDTPAFELKETLMGKYGEDSKLIYDLADQGGELCSLRYDLTVPFARYVAMNGLTSFKRYQIAKVYRRDNPAKGRYREFYQCDFDIAGHYETMGPDFEVIKILTEMLDELNIGDYEIKLNHRKLLDGMLDICGVPPQKFRTICSSIDKLDKQSFEQIKKEMVEEKGLSVETADQIGTFVKERGSPLEVLDRLKRSGSKFMENKGSCVALDELEILFKALEKSGCINRIVFDLSLARGLDYYTGVIYEAVFKGAAQVGSIAAGGRYDNLIGMFGTKQVPAIGVSLGIERVFTIMEQIYKAGKKEIRATETQVLISVLGDDLGLAAELASKLWAAGIKAEFMLNKRVLKHFDRAKASKIPWVVIVGENELKEGVVNLKEFRTDNEERQAATEERVPLDSLVEELQKRIKGTSP